MSPNVFEINEDKIYKDKCCGELYAMFFLVMLKKKCRTSKNFAGPADANQKDVCNILFINPLVCKPLITI